MPSKEIEHRGQWSAMHASCPRPMRWKHHFVCDIVADLVSTELQLQASRVLLAADKAVLIVAEVSHDDSRPLKQFEHMLII